MTGVIFHKGKEEKLLEEKERFPCNGELRLPRFKTPPVLVHQWIRTPSVLILRWNKTP